MLTLDVMYIRNHGVCGIISTKLHSTLSFDTLVSFLKLNCALFWKTLICWLYIFMVIRISCMKNLH